MINLTEELVIEYVVNQVMTDFFEPGQRICELADQGDTSAKYLVEKINLALSEAGSLYDIRGCPVDEEDTEQDDFSAYV